MNYWFDKKVKKIKWRTTKVVVLAHITECILGSFQAYDYFRISLLLLVRARNIGICAMFHILTYESTSKLQILVIFMKFYRQNVWERKTILTTFHRIFISIHISRRLYHFLKDFHETLEIVTWKKWNHKKFKTTCVQSLISMSSQKREKKVNVTRRITAFM